MGVIQQSPGAIGYGQLVFVTQNHIPYAAMRNAAGVFAVPTLAHISAAVAASTLDGPAQHGPSGGASATGRSLDAGAYPIFGLTYIVLYRQQPSPAKAKHLTDFLKWALHQGQQYVKPLVYAPLPTNTIRLNERQIELIK